MWRFITLFFCAAIIFGGIYVFKYHRPGKLIVYFGSEGFEPKSLQIDEGDTVVFRTKLEKDFWPASDLHPMHKIYPEFDSRRPIKFSESWSFRFGNSGIWEYHNHLDPGYKGTIIVGKSGGMPNVVDCDLTANRQQCWQKEIQNKLNADGIQATLALVTNKYGKDEEFAADCHGFAHILGNKAYEKYKTGNELNLTVEGGTVCGYGFYHGFMEKALQSGGNFKEINDFCQQIKKTSPLSTSKACYHGIGHGAIKYVADRHPDGPEGKEANLINGGLELCYKVTVKYGDEYDQCSGGVFMEMANKMVAHEDGLIVNALDPLGICKMQNNRDKQSCYGQMYGVLKSVTHSLMKGALFIEKIPEDEYAQEAIVNYASTVAVVSGDHSDDIEVCRNIQKRLVSHCLKGLAIVMIFRGPVGQEYKSALEFCSLALLTLAEQKYCTGEVLSYSAVSQTTENHKKTCNLAQHNLRTNFCP